jgi:Domain of unknown function (DUF4936)
VRRHYVYYRVPADSLQAAADAVMAMQSALRSRFPGLNTGLLRRPEAMADRVTLMEVYALPGRDLDTDLAAEIEARAEALVARWIDGPRHVETFELLDEGR